MTSKLTPEQRAFTDKVYAVCERNYSAGGDYIVETMDREEIIEALKDQTLRELISHRVEAALNRRWGDDNDPELTQYQQFLAADWSLDQ